MATKHPKARYHLKHSRFSEEDGWRLCDLSLSLSGNIAVSGDNYKTKWTFVDVYFVRSLDSKDVPEIRFSKEFGEYSSDGRVYYGRFVSFVEYDDDSLVTCIGNKLEVIKTDNGQVTSLRKLNGWVSCMSVKGREVYVAFKYSNKFTVFDSTDLTDIRSIILEEIQDGCLFTDIIAIDERLFVCMNIKSANKNRSLVIEEKSGRIVSEFQSPHNTRPSSDALSLTLNAPLGFIAIGWSYFVGTEQNEVRETVFYSLTENSSFLVVDNASKVSRIRTSDRDKIMITGNEWTGDVEIYDMADLYSYHQLKQNLILRLQKDECAWLVNYFALPKEQEDAILQSNSPTENLLLILEEKCVVLPSNVDRLIEAFLEMNTSLFCYNVTNIYQKTRVHATLYERFLATLSAHLTGSLPVDLCNYFNISDANKERITSSQNSGLSLLLLLDDMGIISPREVRALYQPFLTFQLVQAVAKIEEHQTIIEEEQQLFQNETGLTLEGRKEEFIQYLRRRIKSWYETMTPVPWKKSCKWKSTDLFVGSGLILTDSKAKGSLTHIDKECKLDYTEIFSHDKLKSETRIILEGDPGSGKTMLMSQLAYDWSQGKFSEIKILIFLPLKIFQQKTLSEAVKEFYHLDENRLSVSDIEGYLQDEGNASHLLLDGLEEYTGRVTKEEPNEVMKIMTKVKYPACKAVITTRSGYAQMLPKYPMLKLGRFGEIERNSYIEKLFSGDRYKQMKIQTAICNSPFMLDLCATPLLFVMAVHNIKIMERLDNGELDRVSPFMQSMVNTLCSTNISAGQNDRQYDEKLVEDSESASENDQRGKGIQMYSALQIFKGNTSDRDPLQVICSDGNGQFDSAHSSVEEDQLNANAQKEISGEIHSSKEEARCGEQEKSDEEIQAENEEKSDLESIFEDFYVTDNTEELNTSDEPYLTLDKLAFNGLCSGIQQLLWQREFVEKNLIASKMWIDSGILVIEEGLFTVSLAENKEYQGLQIERELTNEPTLADSKDVKERTSVQDTQETSVEREGNHSSSEIVEGFEEQTPHKISDLKANDEVNKYLEEETEVLSGTNSECEEEVESLMENQNTLESTQTDLSNNENKSSRILNQVSLQVRFLHKLIQEWFAAQHLSSILWKSVNSNELQKCLYEHLPSISPTDLHYTLRFTCFLCPPSYHLIVKFLLQTYCLEEGDFKYNIMNCIFLCFAEYIGDEGLDILEAIAVVCQENITICGEDSRLLQQAKVSFLELASSNWIPIKSVLLADLLESATEDALTFNSGVKMAVLDTLEMLQISRWDQTLHEVDCVPIMTFISRCDSLKETRLHLPLTPPGLDKAIVNSLQRTEKTVTWKIGPKMIHTLDTISGRWTMTNSSEDADDMNARQSTKSHGIQARPTLRVGMSISKQGGFLQIPGTDVSLSIPPGSLDDDTGPCLIQMGIIPCNYYDTSTSFASNSSVTVELLPNNLRLKQPVQLTLPHCLKLKKNVDYKARIFMSHHEGKSFLDAKPRWEQTNQKYVLDDKTCTIWLQRFCWTKYEIDDEIVEAKKIVVFTAAKPLYLPENVAEIEVGYHLDLPGPIEFLQLNPDFILAQRKSFLFLKDGNHSLKLLLERIIPRTWRYSTSDEDSKAPQEIPFKIVASSMEHSCGFILVRDARGYDSPICTFIVSQEGNVLQQKVNIRPKTLLSANQQPNDYPLTEAHSQTVRTKIQGKSQVKGEVEDNLRQLVHDVKLEESSQELLFQQPSRNGTKTAADADNAPVQRINKQPYEASDTGSNFLRPYHQEQPMQNDMNTHSQLATYSGQRMLQYRRLQVPGVMNPFIQQYHYSQQFCVYPYNFQFGENDIPNREHNRQSCPLRYGIINAIAKKLNSKDILGNDWRQLADKLGFTMDDISMFENAPNVTYEVINSAVKKGWLTSHQQLKTILEEIGRIDAASVITQSDS